MAMSSDSLRIMRGVDKCPSIIGGKMFFIFFCFLVAWDFGYSVKNIEQSPLTHAVSHVLFLKVRKGDVFGQKLGFRPRYLR